MWNLVTCAKRIYTTSLFLVEVTTSTNVPVYYNFLMSRLEMLKFSEYTWKADILCLGYCYLPYAPSTNPLNILTLVDRYSFLVLDYKIYTEWKRHREWVFKDKGTKEMNFWCDYLNCIPFKIFIYNDCGGSIFQFLI